VWKIKEDYVSVYQVSLAWWCYYVNLFFLSVYDNNLNNYLIKHVIVSKLLTKIVVM